MFLSGASRSSLYKNSRLAALLLVAALGCAKKPLAPTAAIDSPANAHVGLPVQLDGSRSAPSADLPDPQSLPVTYQWSLVVQPGGSTAHLDGATGPRPRFLPDLAGTYLVQLIVRDFANASMPVQAAIQATADCAPIVSSAVATPASVNVSQPVALTGIAQAAPCATAAGGDALVAWSWVVAAAPAGSTAQIVASGQLDTSFVPDVRGSYDLALKATDALGLESALAHVVIIAMACGDNAPSVDTLVASPAAPDIGAAVQFRAQVTDADSQPPCALPRSLSYSWSVAAAPAGSKALLGSRTSQTPTLVPDVAGDYVLALIVTDQLGRGSVRQTVTVHASPCGGAVPVVAATSSANAIATGDTVQLLSLVQDPDGPPSPCGAAPATYAYSWRIVAAPLASRAQLNGTGLMNPSFSADAPGTYVFSITVTASTGKVSDPALVTVQASVCGSVPPSVTINAVNGASTGLPVLLSPSVDDSANACKPTAPYRFSWTLRSAPAGSAARLSGITAAGDSRQAAVSLVPDVSGDYTVQVVVVDALGLASVPASRTVTVAQCSAPLTAVITAPAGAVTSQPLQLHAAPFNPNLGPACPLVTPLVSYSWALLGQPSGGTAQLNNAADAAPSFIPTIAGRYTMRLVVSDSAGNQSLASVATVDVTSCNAKLTVLVPDTSGLTGQPLLLSALVTDPNASCSVVAPLRYQWSLVNAPAGSTVSLNNPGVSSPSFVPDLAGAYLVSLLVIDAAGNASAPVNGKVAVANCTAPPTIISIAVVGGVTGLPVALSASVSDLNSGGACTAGITPYAYDWSLIARPAGSVAALNNGAAFSPSFTPDAAGTYSVSLRVIDAAGNRSAQQTADITVANCAAPVAVSITAPLGAKTLATVTLTATTNDAQDTSCGIPTLSYAWTLISKPAGSTAALDLPFSIPTHFVPDLPGDYVATLLVTDTLGNRGSATTTVVAMGCGNNSGSSLQVAVSAITASPELGQRTVLAAVVNDSNSLSCANQATAPYTYTWSLTVPAGSNAILLNSNSAQPNFVPDLAGVYGFTVTVTDALGYRAAPLGSGSVTAFNCTLVPGIVAVGANQLTYSQVQLVGAGTTACSQPFTYAWSFDSLPIGSNARFNNAAGRTPSFTVDVPNGTWVARLTLTDSITGAKTSSTRTVTSGSCGSSLPYATAGISLPFPVSVSTPQPDPAAGSTIQYLPNYQLQLDGTRSADPAAACTGPLTFAWSTYSTPPNSTAALYPVTAAKPVFTPDVAGDYIFQLGVGDGRFTSAPSFLHITVSDPLADSILPAAASRGVLWNDAEPDPTSPTANPSIAFYEKNVAGTFYDLRFARCSGGCSTGSPSWIFSTIEADAIDVKNGNAATAQVSLKFLPGTGTPVVAYRYDSTCEMHYAVLNGASWNISRIDALDVNCSGEHGEIQLMFVGALNLPAVAYHTHGPANPTARYAACAAGCTTGLNSAWTKQDVDAVGNAGHYMTAFVSPVSKLPRLAYQDDNTHSLHYAECNGSCAAGTGAWSLVTLIAGGGAPNNTLGVGFWSTMAVAPNGLAGVAFENGTTNQVQLVTCKSACATASNWTTIDIATLTAGNYFPSLQYDAQSQAHVTYIDSANRILRYAIQSGNSFQYFDIDHGVDDGHSSFILTPLGSTHVSYALTTGLKYYPFGD